MAYLLIGNAIILLTIWVGRHNRISLYSPLLLSAMVWQVVFISGLFFGSRFYPLTERAFVMWLTWFSISSLFYLFLCGQPKPADRTELRRVPLDYSLILVILCFWLAYHIRSIGSTGPAHFFFNLRMSASQNVGFASLGILDRLYPWVFALFVFEHVNARDDNRLLRRLLWCVMLLYAFATMAKFSILTPVLAWAVIKGMRGTLPKRKLLVLVPFVFVLMVALHFVRDPKGGQFVFAKFLSVYTYSPLVALGYMNAPPLDSPFGAHVFRLAYVIVDAVIGGVDPVHSIQPIVAIPYLTNVYTVIRPFALDFGLPGVAAGAAVFGILFGLTFHFARANRQLPMIIYAGLSVVLIAQFFDDLLFTMLAGQLQYLVAAVFFTTVSRRVDVGR